VAPPWRTNSASIESLRANAGALLVGQEAAPPVRFW